LAHGRLHGAELSYRSNVILVADDLRISIRLCHEFIRESGDIVPPVLTSALDVSGQLQVPPLYPGGWVCRGIGLDAVGKRNILPLPGPERSRKK
jgi:hypothetical protein